MVKCRPVTPRDYEVINAWYELRDIPSLSEHLFPLIGYMVDGIGAGFLYQTDSTLCFIDGYISNPKSSREDRAEAFDSISHNIIRYAKDAGFRSILAYTQNREIEKRCIKFLFEPKGTYNLFVKEL